MTIACYPLQKNILSYIHYDNAYQKTYYTIYSYKYISPCDTPFYLIRYTLILPIRDYIIQHIHSNTYYNAIQLFILKPYIHIHVHTPIYYWVNNKQCKELTITCHAKQHFISSDMHYDNGYQWTSYTTYSYTYILPCAIKHYILSDIHYDNAYERKYYIIYSYF